MNDESDLSAFSTSIPLKQEPLTFERMMHFIQEFKDEYPEPPVEILSPTEYFRRTGFRLPLSEETLAAIAPAVSPLGYLLSKHVLARENPFPLSGVLASSGSLTEADLREAIEALPEGDLAVEPERFSALVEELKAPYIAGTPWTISPKTRHQLERLAARKRRQYRAWLRAKRQRRARQRRHNQGLR